MLLKSSSPILYNAQNHREGLRPESLFISIVKCAHLSAKLHQTMPFLQPEHVF